MTCCRVRNCPREVSKILPLYLFMCVSDILLSIIWLCLYHLHNDMFTDIIWGILVISFTSFLIIVSIYILIYWINNNENTDEIQPIISKSYQNGIPFANKSEVDSGISLDIEL